MMSNRWSPPERGLACSPCREIAFSLRMHRPFSCQGPVGVSTNLIVFFFFLIQLNFYLFIYSFPTNTFTSDRTKPGNAEDISKLSHFARSR